MRYKQFKTTNSLFCKQSKNCKLFVVLIIISIFFMFFSKNKSVLFFKDAVNFIFMPSQERLSDVLHLNKNRTDNFVSLLNAHNDNFELTKKLKSYQVALIENQALKSENAQLKELLGLESTLNFNLLNAKVIGRTIDDWYSAIIINKGFSSGLKKSQTVIINKAGMPILVGQVVEVFKNYSKVLLITNMDLNIVGYVVGSNQYGVVQGENSQLLRMKYLYSIKNIRQNTAVFSTGFGGVIPRGLYVGKVDSIYAKKSSEFFTVFLKPAEEIFNLTYVSVILGQNQ